MAVTIRLQRAGTRNRPFFRVVVADSRRARDGRCIDRLGYYDPLPNPEVISIEVDRAAEWIRKGARPSDAVRTLIRRLERRQAAGTAATERPTTSRRPRRATVSEASAAEETGARPTPPEASAAPASPPEGAPESADPSAGETPPQE